jgi:uridine kinase
MDYRETDRHSSNRRLASLITAIIDARARMPKGRALLVGISGIDGSGKGFVSAKLADALRSQLINVALIAADDWLNLPAVCIDRKNPGEHFYKHVLRLDEMFEHLVLPLCHSRKIDVVADCGDARATSHRKYRYHFQNIDVVLLEGIFLFKPHYRGYFDFKVWIDCSFETALQRAIERGQEGLSPAETRNAFETIYFPAQRLHLERDRPNEIADFVFVNEA